MSGASPDREGQEGTSPAGQTREWGRHSPQCSHPFNAPVSYPKALEEPDLGLSLPSAPVFFFSAHPGSSKRQRLPQIPDVSIPPLPLQAAEPPFPPGEGSRLEILPGSSRDPLPDLHEQPWTSPCQGQSPEGSLWGMGAAAGIFPGDLNGEMEQKSSKEPPALTPWSSACRVSAGGNLAASSGIKQSSLKI